MAYRLLLLYVILIIAVGTVVRGQVGCFERTSCLGDRTVTTQDECCDNRVAPLGASFVLDGVEGCFPCPVVFGFAQDTFTAPERGEPYTMEFGFFSGVAVSQINVTFQLSFGTAGPEDITLDAPPLSFESQEHLIHNISFKFEPDGVALEGDETFSLSFTGLEPGDLVFGSTIVEQLDGTIVDLDELEISLVKTRDVPESTNSTVCVQFSANFSTDFNINVLPATPVNATAIATVGEDYLAPPTSILAEGNTHGPSTDLCFEVQIINDEFVEEREECFALAISLPSPETDDLSVSITGDNTATCCIQDDDSVTIGLSKPVYEFSEDDTDANLTVSITSGSLMRPVVVTLSLGSNTAIAGEDFINNGSFPITFTESLTSVQVPLNLIDDSVHEASEEFLASLSTEESSSVVSLSPVAALVRILDNDDVQFTFRQDSYTFNESSGSVSIFMDKVGQTDLTIVLMVTGPLQAETGLNIDQNITFGPTDTEISITFSIQDDIVALEPTEVLEWSLSLVSSFERVSVQPTDSTEILILDDDALLLNLAKTREVPEDMNSTACLQFSNPFATDLILDVLPATPVNVTNTATPNADYIEPFKSLRANSVIHGPTTDLCFEVQILDDQLVEEEECFAFSIIFSGGETGDLAVSFAPGQNTATCCIQDNDAVTVGFGAELYEFPEDAISGETIITVLITEGELRRPVTVTLSFADITTVAGEDYENIGPLSITFNETVTSEKVTIPVLDDTLHEQDEEISATLTVAEDSDIVVLDPASALIRILDNEEVSFTFRESSHIFNESDGLVTIYVDKIGDTDQTISLLVVGPLQAETGLTMIREISFSPDDTEIPITFTIQDDSIALEPTEVLQWTLSVVPIPVVERVQVQPQNTTVISILDDDELLIQLSKSGQVSEDQNSTACVSFSNPFATDFSISVASGDVPDNNTVPATLNEDYLAPPAVLQALSSIHGPDSDLCFEIAIIDDELVETEECFAVSISLEDTGLMVAVDEDSDLSVCCILDNDRVTIGFNQSTYSAVEPAGSVTLTVTVLSGTLLRPTQVTFFTTDGTATSIGPVDFIGIPNFLLEFDTDTLSLSVTVPLSNDDVLEDTEFFFGNLISSDSAVELAPSEARVNIIDLNDEVTIGFSPVQYVVREGEGEVTLFVEVLEGSLEREVTVLVATIPNTATESDPADYEAVNMVLTFQPGVLNHSISVTILNDLIVEGNETFFVELDNQGQAATIQPDSEVATVVILDDFVDSVTFGFLQSQLTAEEGEVVEVCVGLLTGIIERDVLMSVSSEDGSATGGEDYVPILDQQLTFTPTTPGNIICFNLTTLTDNRLEPRENLFLNLVSDDLAILLIPRRAEVRIDDINRVTVALAQDSYSVLEEDGAFIEVCAVIEEGVVEREISVNIASTDGTATSQGTRDFIALNADLVFSIASGPTACTNVTIVNDAIFEDPESFTLTLSSSDPGVDVSPNRTVATATINDDDGLVIGFVLETDSVLEETPGRIEVCVEVRNGGELERSVTVSFSTADGSGSQAAIGGEDYEPTNQLLTFSPTNQNTALCVLVLITNDSNAEGPETFFGRLTTSEVRVTLTPDQTTITILDDDVVRIGFVNDPYQAPEESGFATLTVQVMGELGTELLVNLATEDIGEAIAGVDYEPLDIVLTFSEDVHTIQINVTLIDDLYSEGDEDFLARLEILTTGTNAELVPDDNEPVTILDNDEVVIGMEETSVDVDESVGQRELCASVMNGELKREVQVAAVFADGTAIDGEDYSSASVSLTFNTDTNRACFNVSILDDTRYELREDFFVNLTTSEPLVTLVSFSTIVSIEDDDSVTIGWETNLYEVSESDGTVEVCAVLEEGTASLGDILPLVDIVTMDVTATSGGANPDYLSTPSPSSFNFQLNTPDRMCALISIQSDGVVEGQETFLAILSISPTPRVLLDPAMTEISIRDSDTATIGFAPAAYQVNEGDGAVTLTVRVLEGTLAAEVEVQFSTQDNTAVSDGDFSAVSTQLTFSSTQTEHNVTVNIMEDLIAEGDESFLANLVLTSAPVQVTISPAQASVLITDNDEVTIGFAPAVYQVSEGDGAVTLRVAILEGTLAAEVEVEISTQDNTAVSVGDDVDFTAVSAQLTFSPTQTSIDVSVTIMEDLIAEGDESFLANLVLTSATVQVTISPAQASVLITDNDVPVIGFEQTQYTVAEDDVDGIEVCVSLMTPPSLDREVTVSLSSQDGTAEAPADYVPINTDLTFDADNARRCVTITVLEDDVVEGTEVFTLSLESSDDVVIAPEEAQVEILDATQEILVMFAQPSYTFIEDRGVGTIVVTKSGTSSEDFQVRVVGGPSTQTDIVRSADGIDTIITFGAGQSAPDSIVITFNLTDDEVALEAVETYQVSLEVVTQISGIVVDPQPTTVNVLDDDVVNVGFGRASVTVNESDGEFMMCVLKDRETVLPVEVTISTSPGTATEGEDYNPANVPSTVFIPASSLSICFVSNSIIDDQIALEFDETFSLSIDQAGPDSGGQITIANGSTVIIIVDDDVVLVRFEQASYTFSEAAGVAEVCLIKETETAVSVVVKDITTADGTATDGLDYVGGSFSVSFTPPASDRRCLNLTLIADSIGEDSEDFTVSLNLPAPSNPRVIAGDPATATVNIIDAGTQTLVNDTVIGDPLFTVPLLVSQDQLNALNIPKLSLCYEIHGEHNQWFNLITDECASVNARYAQFNQDLNVIDEIGVRAVDNANQCVNIRVDVKNCMADVNGTPLGFADKYSVNGVSVRRYRNRVRISVPNCNDLTLVMWVFCETRTLDDPITGGRITGDLIKFVVMRGLNFGNRDAHGLLGQFWNVPVSVTPFTGTLKDGTTPNDHFIVNITTRGEGIADTRSYTGALYDFTWEFQKGPCLYVGGRQAGPIYEVRRPNDNVIEDSYEGYKVDSAFSEEGYDFGLFQEERCVAGGS